MRTVLTLNGGSSSIRFALYARNDAATRLLDGKIERIGVDGTSMSITDSRNAGRRDFGGGDAAPLKTHIALDAKSHCDVIEHLLEWLRSQGVFADLDGVGHRIVHGMMHSGPERVTPQLLADFRRSVPYDPEHMPRALELLGGISRVQPDLPQVACFDTAFHHGMPRVAKLLPLPRRFEANGVQRYGFHGLSYTYLLSELARLGDPAAVRGRVILAHLGNGASLAAVRDGCGIDTSMGFTPTSGLVMSTRSGDLDPGILSFLAATEHMDTAGYQKMVMQESGLLGVSETSSDIRDLLAAEHDDVRAAEAVSLFCYQVKKWIGSFAAVLGGLDSLVFAGGIGENAAAVRGRICEGLGFLGIELDAALNAQGATLISSGARHVAVRMLRTDEESVIARMTLQTLALENGAA